MVLRGIAKGKSIEFDRALPFADGEAVEVSVSAARNGTPKVDSAELMLAVLREPPHLSQEDIDAFNQSLKDAQLPASEGHQFDNEAA